MPAEMTQTGIAAHVEINYSHVPRAVKRLQRDGFVNELMAHSSDNPTGRRRKAYYLTERGLKSARELMNNLMKYPVGVKNDDGTVTTLSLLEIRERYHIDEEFIKIFDHIAKESVFDIEIWNEHVIERKKSVEGLKEHRKELPMNRSIKKTDQNRKVTDEIHRELLTNGILLDLKEYPFPIKLVDREAEKEELSEILHGHDRFITTITGPSGIGKSALVAETIRSSYISNKVNEIPLGLLWFDLNKTDQEKYNRKIKILDDNRELLKEYISKFNGIIVLDDLNFSDNKNGLLFNITQPINIEENNELDISQGLKTQGQFDDVIRDILKNVLEWNISNTKSKLIIISQEKSIQKLVQKQLNSMGISIDIFSINISGFSSENVRIMLGPEFEPELADAIHYQTKGNPGIIQLIKQIDERKRYELKKLSPEQASMGLILIAHEMMENSD